MPGDRTCECCRSSHDRVQEGDAIAASGEPDTVLFAGRMTTLKGGHVLIAAAARATRLLGRPVRLIMAGEGPQKDAWRSLATSLGVSSS